MQLEGDFIAATEFQKSGFFKYPYITVCSHEISMSWVPE